MTFLAINKKAGFDYQILQTFEAGIELKGFEVKSIKSGRINLVGSYVIIRDNQAWLLNSDIPPYQPKNTPADYDSKRTRRLLLKRPEIHYLLSQKQSAGLTLIPLEMYIKNREIKLKIALAKRRKKADKRELLKKRTIEREMGRFKTLRRYLRG